MFSLRRLIGKDDIFFDLLDAGADEAKASIDHFARYLQAVASGASPANIDDFIHTRRKEKQIRHQLTEALGRTFVTPLDREDIEALSFALYRIPKQVEKVVERISIYPGPFPAEAFRRQVELLIVAAASVAGLVKLLRNQPDLAVIRDANERLQYAEGEADKVMLQQLRELYQGPCTAKDLLILRELHEMVEQAVDRCRNVGNIVLQIALKDA